MKYWKFLIYLLIPALVFPAIAGAAMQSDHYVIYENVMHSFDGPVISGVSANVSGQSVTVAWTTDVVADSFVVYSTDPTFTSSYEQGSSAKNSTSHSVVLIGLNASTLYYYRVRSERVNGGITTDETQRSFTTAAAAGGGEQPTPPAGGGLLIIDKTDKVPPVISKVAVTRIAADSVTVNWETDEAATSFVEYGETGDYGTTYGDWATGTVHNVSLPDLQSGLLYHFRAISSDGWGNIGYSEDFAFTTAEGIVEKKEKKPPAKPEELKKSILAEANRRITEFIGRLFPAVPTERLGPSPLTTIGSLSDLTGLMGAPIIAGEPRVEVGATKVTVFWTTDIKANGLVALAPEDAYRPGAGEPYQQIVGDPEIYTDKHEVRLYNLVPDTLYHFQLRSRAEIGPVARSRDFIFRTRLEELSITSFFAKIIDSQTAVFKWVTNKESDSAIRFAPYHGNVLALDLSKTVKDNTMTGIHELTISEFEGGTFYNVELSSMDQAGNVATQELSHFSTSENDLPPEITHIKTDSTVFLNRGNKIQTIISWMTNEPSTSRVYYQKGVHGGDVQLAESTGLNTNYTKEHVIVVTKFKPGAVYSFRVESIDSGGNVSLSKVHTFMTAKKRESIIQVIMRILEETFGWMKKLT